MVNNKLKVIYTLQFILHKLYHILIQNIKLLIFSFNLMWYFFKLNFQIKSPRYYFILAIL